MKLMPNVLFKTQKNACALNIGSVIAGTHAAEILLATRAANVELADERTSKED